MNLKHNILALLGKQGQQSTAYYPIFMLHVQNGRVCVSMISLSTGKLLNPYEAEQGKKRRSKKSKSMQLARFAQVGKVKRA
jgi:hypothetical protein